MHNVVGCLSSSKGKDFKTVLQSIIEIEEPQDYGIEPPTGRWEYAGAVLGVRSSLAWVTWTLNTSECPSDAAESSLSQILLDSGPSKYYLSRKSCRGILRRAAKRGKALPKKLKLALKIQAGIIAPSELFLTTGEVFCLHDQGGDRIDCFENQSGTLLAQTSHAPVVYENHGIDGRYTGPHDVVPTMSARYGTGGNNVPFVTSDEVYCIVGNVIDRQLKNGGNGQGIQKDLAYTLTATDRHAVFCRQRVDIFREDDVASTQSARQYKDATDIVLDRNMGIFLLKRLLPQECERLQGFPDDWTNLPGAKDSGRYKALGNSVAISCVEYLLRHIAFILRNSL